MWDSHSAEILIREFWEIERQQKETLSKEEDFGCMIDLILEDGMRWKWKWKGDHESRESSNAQSAVTPSTWSDGPSSGMTSELNSTASWDTVDWLSPDLSSGWMMAYGDDDPCSEDTRSRTGT